MPVVGEKAPEFALKNQNGETVHLSDFRGQKVLLFAFPKAGTSGCTAQACGLRDEMPAFEGVNAVVLGLSPDEPDALLKWKEQEHLPYDLLSDPKHKTLNAYGVWGEKSMYGKKYTGVIRSHWIIDEEGTVIDAQINVSPSDSVARAVAFLTSEAQSG